MSNSYKLLALCDSPTVQTGFARVAQNLLSRWKPSFETIDVWAINYQGWPVPPEVKAYVDKIFPPGCGKSNGYWQEPQSLQMFLEVLVHGGYTHLWMMQDSFNLCKYKLPEELKKACAMKGIRSFLYYPVDAPIEEEWTTIIQAVDQPVAYTEYGKRETLRVMPACPKLIEVMPHGVDTKTYYPLPDRDAIRAEIIPDKFCSKDDFLMINVNANQRRKNPTRSLQVLKALLDAGEVPAKLLMHMPRTDDTGTVDLEVAGSQLGLKMGKDWAHNGDKFIHNNGLLKENDLNKFYNVADLGLTTTLGEGWGNFGNECLAAGTACTFPAHTSCKEIYNQVVGNLGMADRATLLPLSYEAESLLADNSRMRWGVDVKESARIITEKYKAGLYASSKRCPLNDKVKTWLDWDRIAEKWLKIMAVK